MLVGRELAFEIILHGGDVGVSHELLYIVELITGLLEPMGKGRVRGVGVARLEMLAARTAAVMVL